MVNFLVEASITRDKEEGIGVNIILNLSIPGAGGIRRPCAGAWRIRWRLTPLAAGLGDLFGGGLMICAARARCARCIAASASQYTPTITLNLRRISPAGRREVHHRSGRLKFRLEDNAVIITPEGVVQGRVVTRLYPVQPTIMDMVVDRDADTRTITAKVARSLSPWRPPA